MSHKIIQEYDSLKKVISPAVLSKLYFTFHLRLAYCLLKLSRFITDNLLTMACLGFRGCRDKMGDKMAEEASFMLVSKFINGMLKYLFSPISGI